MSTVFFSWQIDTPTNSGRNLIERAMQDAIKALKSDASVEEALRDDDLTIDKDTQGVAGSPPIMDTIFAKIDAARVFLADLTFVGRREDGRRMPNSNVTLEYGWALKSLGNQSIIGVMNVAYGDPTEFPLPFDLGHLRHPIGFNCPSDANEATRKEQRRQLASKFKDALKAVLAIETPSDAAMPPAYVPLEPKDGRARFFPRAHAIGVLQTKKSPFGSTEFESPKWTTIDDGPAMWLRVLPTRPLDRPFTIAAIAAAMEPGGEPVYPLNKPAESLNLWRTRADDGYALAIGVDRQTPFSVVQTFVAGEVWSIDTSYLSQNTLALVLSEANFIWSLRAFGAVLTSLGVPKPYRWIAGVEGAKGRSLALIDTTRRVNGNHHCVADLIEVDGDFSGEYGEAQAALEPFFAAIFDKCGLAR